MKDYPQTNFEKAVWNLANINFLTEWLELTEEQKEYLLKEIENIKNLINNIVTHEQPWTKDKKGEKKT